MRAFAWFVVVMSTLMLLGPRAANAHEFRPAVLSLQADDAGDVAVRFVPPPMSAMGPVTDTLAPVAPEHCRVRSAVRWSCGEPGLSGTIAIAGLGANPVDVVVDVRWSDGAALQTRLGPQRSSVPLARGAVVASGWQAFRSYASLGVEHIVLGFDHLLFVLALLLLGGTARDHLRTITAFTVGHAVTLVGQSMLDVRIAGPWLEACIVASIAVAAAEAAQSRPSRAVAWPWALGFGLVHGLGFAGALRDLGIPSAHRMSALLSFNVGVEVGQLCFVVVALGVGSLVSRTHPWREPARRGLAFVVGAVAVAWTLERISVFWVA